MLRLAIIVEVRLYRDGLSQILGHCDDLEVVLTAADWRRAVTGLSDSRPDVVLLDVRAAGAHLALRELAAATPHSRLVALGLADDDADIVAWAKLGVDGYVTSDNSLRELLDVIVSVSRDEMPCSPRAAAALLRQVALLADDSPDPGQLTTRQLQIVQLIERATRSRRRQRSRGRGRTSSCEPQRRAPETFQAGRPGAGALSPAGVPPA